MLAGMAARWNGWNVRVAVVAVGLVALASAAWAEAPRQAAEDAWWTGPLLAPGAGNLPVGHALIEPYFFDVVAMGSYDGNGERVAAPRAHYYGSQTYILYGLTDALTVGVLPRFGFHDRGARGRSSQIGVGDLGVIAQVGLTRFDDERGIPALAINVSQTLPIGNYDQLGDRPADGFGSGAFTTALALRSQYLFWMPTGRILRMRLNVGYAMSTSPVVRDVSVYGTMAGFRGRAHPGAVLTAIAAWEYNASRHWVAALDVAYDRASSTEVRGMLEGRAFAADSGAASSLSIAPALEYNLSARVGVIAGLKLTIAGRNTARAIVPITAINLVL